MNSAAKDDIYGFSATLLSGAPIHLSAFRGQVLLIANTASQCGFTPQYTGLQALYDAYRDRGFAVLGFPCNQFGGQEPGDSAQIGAFCQKNYGVSFPVFEKVDVNGPAAHPLFQFLTHARPGLFGTRRIKWNFTKFLIDRSGHVVARFAPRAHPSSLSQPIQALLAEDAG